MKTSIGIPLLVFLFCFPKDLDGQQREGFEEVKSSPLPNFDGGMPRTELHLYTESVTDRPGYQRIEVNPHSITSVTEQDSLALMDIYNQMNGPNWTDRTNWGSDEPVSTWHGVTVDDGRVVVLNLANNNLQNQIPPSIGNLTNLVTLSFASNNLEGPIPQEIGNLTNLERLFLSNSQLSGEIPASIGNLTNLLVLLLNNNQLTGQIPSSFGSLTELLLLYLHENNLTGNIPPGLGNLSTLRELLLRDNQLAGTIPTELSNLSNVEWFVLGRNNLTGTIPPELGNLKNIVSLFLLGNELEGGIPPSLGNLENARFLNLANNQLTGTIPPELGNMTNLEFLGLHENNLTGSIPSALGNLSNLIELFLNDNQLSGEIPASIGNLTNLDRLILGNNQLTGQIPASIGNLTELLFLGLHENNLTGNIPPELGNLSNLRELFLRDNQLTGSIPPELGNLSNLQFFVLSNNSITGSIPPELGNLSNVMNLVLGNNNLMGSIPSEIGNLPSIEVLSLFGNSLEGPIPIELGNLSSLRAVILLENNFEGAIPESFANLTNLQAFDIRDNRFTFLPDLSPLPNLATLNVQNNRLQFDSIEPNIGVATVFTYAPQAPVSEDEVKELFVGDELQLSVEVGGENNQYQWFKDGEPIEGVNNNIFVISSVIFEEGGKYMCEINNPIAPALTLYSGEFEVLVGDRITLPDAPQLLSPANNTEIDELPVLFQWDPVEGAEKYLLQISTNENFNPSHRSFETSETSFELDDLENDTQYYWRVRGEEENGVSEWSEIWSFATLTVVSVEEIIAELPEKFMIHQNYPNPFNPSTIITFALPDQLQVTLEIYNMLGQRVNTLISGDTFDAGYYNVVWDGRDQFGRTIASGIYIYRMQAGSFTDVKQMVFIK